MLFSILFRLYRACFTHLISSNLSCNLCLWYCDQLVHFDKEINGNVYRHSLWEYSNVSTVHLDGIWHLIWRYLSKTVLGGHPVFSGHYSISRGCPLNTGFTVKLSLFTMFNTSWPTGIPAKNIFPNPYYCYSRSLAITSWVKCTISPARPRMHANSASRENLCL